MSDTPSLEEVVRRIVRSEVAAALAEGKPAGLVTVAEFAQQRSISPSTVRVAIREHRLDVTRIGRAVRVATDATIYPDAVDCAAARARANPRTLAGKR